MIENESDIKHMTYEDHPLCQSLCILIASFIAILLYK